MTYYESLEDMAAHNPNLNDMRVLFGSETVSLRTRFGLWLNKGSPIIGKPETESNLVYVPGSDKVLNLTRALDGKVHYKQRTIAAEFTVLRTKKQLDSIRHELETILQGQWLRFYFVQGGELWDGLFDVEMTPGDYNATVSIKVTCDPFRKGLVGGTEIPVQSVTMNRTSLSLKAGDSSILVATVLPANATNPTVAWSSTNSTVAEVKNGVVTALQSGNCTIKASAQNGKSAACSVLVQEVIITNSAILGRCTLGSMSLGRS